MFIIIRKLSIKISLFLKEKLRSMSETEVSLLALRHMKIIQHIISKNKIDLRADDTVEDKVRKIYSVFLGKLAKKDLF